MEANLKMAGYPCWRRTLMGTALCLMLSACAMHWPWHHRPKPSPPAVHYVDVGGDWADDIRQYWDRNTLKLDLTALSGDGEATVMPIGSAGWPVRLEFQVRPGSFARLEVLADQRVVFDLPPLGGVLTLKLDPGAYQPKTASITLRWSAADGSAH